MPRNFERRVEVMFPVEAENLRRRIVEEIIPTYLEDTLRTRMLRPDGTYQRIAAADKPPRRSQSELLTLAATREEAAEMEESLAPSFDAVAAAADGNGLPARRPPQAKKTKALRGPLIRVPVAPAGLHAAARSGIATGSTRGRRQGAVAASSSATAA